MKVKRKNPPRESMSRSSYSLGKALLIIFGSMMMVSGSFFLIQWYFSSVYGMRLNDPQYQIVAIVQTGPKKEALKTVYLAELLELSTDQPTNLYQFNTKDAESKLLGSPLIKAAQVKKVKPGVVYIDYTVREPIAFLGDYTNIAIDQEGYLFPFQPFFTPKKFPEIYLGINDSTTEKFEEVSYGKPLKDPRFLLALEVFQLVNEECCSQTSHLKKIDVSQADSPSYGLREIIVEIEDHYEKSHDDKTVLCVHSRIIRLNAKNYREGLQEYKQLREYLVQAERKKEIDFSSNVYKPQGTIIDLRIPQLSFVKE